MQFQFRPCQAALGREARRDAMSGALAMAQWRRTVQHCATAQNASQHGLTIRVGDISAVAGEQQQGKPRRSLETRAFWTTASA